jgi:predicted Rossmann fold flavoprotein
VYIVPGISNHFMQSSFDVIIIGAGAAGLMAALAAANMRVNGAAPKVLLLDGRDKIGAKILVAGGGRCNVTNEFIHPSRFHTESDVNAALAFKGDGGKSFVGRVLRAFSVEQTHRFFESIGVPLKLEETGKYFPVSNSARTVLEALVQSVAASGAELKTNVRVQDISFSDNYYQLKTSRGEYSARSIVICSGGLALPKSGSDGAGYAWAEKFGHTIIFTTPALSPLLSEHSPFTHLSGIAIPVRLQSGDKSTFIRYDGSFLFTHHGYSGPVALNISRHVVRNTIYKKVLLRLLTEVEDGEENRFWHEFVKANARQNVVNALCQYFPRRLSETLISNALGESALTKMTGKLNGEEQQNLKSTLLNHQLEISEVADYVKAEATAGGVSLAELEPATMMSKLQEGLFFAGEVCDVDGWLGGYNFQWAWSSGTVAGRAAARFALRKS